MSEISQAAPAMHDSDAEPIVPRQSIALSKRMRFTLFVHGVILPAILLCMSLGGQSPLGEAPWQSGELRVYVAMLLQPVGWLWFTPMILYAMVSLGTWTIKPDMEQKIWVRVGIYIGVLLALHYMVLLFLIIHIGMLTAAVVALPCWHLVLWGLNYYWRRQISIWQIMLFMTLCALLIVVIQTMGTDVLMFPWFVCFFSLIATPILNVVAYISAALAVQKIEFDNSRPDRKRLIGGLVTLLIAWLIQWRFAILAMLDEYSKLPTTDPNCYLSSAASYGHPLLTRATRRGQVTVCMRRLKFLEIAFKVSMPATHRLVRRGYDVFCPPLARFCQRNTLPASATCLALMPLEILAELLRVGLRIERRRIDAIYRSRG